VPHVVFDSDENGGQNSYQELHVPLHDLARGAVRIYLYLREQLHGLLASRGLHLETGEVAEVVFEEEEDEARDDVSDEVVRFDAFCLADLKQALLAVSLHCPVLQLLCFGSKLSAEDEAQVARGDLATTPVLVE